MQNNNRNPHHQSSSGGDDDDEYHVSRSVPRTARMIPCTFRTSGSGHPNDNNAATQRAMEPKPHHRASQQQQHEWKFSFGSGNGADPRHQSSSNHHHHMDVEGDDNDDDAESTTSKSTTTTLSEVKATAVMMANNNNEMAAMMILAGGGDTETPQQQQQTFVSVTPSPTHMATTTATTVSPKELQLPHLNRTVACCWHEKKHDNNGTSSTLYAAENPSPVSPPRKTVVVNHRQLCLLNAPPKSSSYSSLYGKHEESLANQTHVHNRHKIMEHWRKAAHWNETNKEENDDKPKEKEPHHHGHVGNHNNMDYEEEMAPSPLSRKKTILKEEQEDALMDVSATWLPLLQDSAAPAFLLGKHARPSRKTNFLHEEEPLHQHNTAASPQERSSTPLGHSPSIKRNLFRASQSIGHHQYEENKAAVTAGSPVPLFSGGLKPEVSVPQPVPFLFSGGTRKNKSSLLDAEDEEDDEEMGGTNGGVVSATAGIPLRLQSRWDSVSPAAAPMFVATTPFSLHKNSNVRRTSPSCLVPGLTQTAAPKAPCKAVRSLPIYPSLEQLGDDAEDKVRPPTPFAPMGTLGGPVVNVDTPKKEPFHKTPTMTKHRSNAALSILMPSSSESPAKRGGSPFQLPGPPPPKVVVALSGSGFPSKDSSTPQVSNKKLKTSPDERELSSFNPLQTAGGGPRWTSLTPPPPFGAEMARSSTLSSISPPSPGLSPSSVARAQVPPQAPLIPITSHIRDIDSGDEENESEVNAIFAMKPKVKSVVVCCEEETSGPTNNSGGSGGAFHQLHSGRAHSFSAFSRPTERSSTAQHENGGGLVAPAAAKTGLGLNHRRST